MNAIGMFVQQLMTGETGKTLLNSNVNTKTDGTTALFSMLLEQQGISLNEGTFLNSGKTDSKLNVLGLLTNIQTDSNTSDKTDKELIDPNVEQLVMEGLQVNPELQPLLQPIQNNQEIHPKVLVEFQKQLSDIFTKFESLLSEVTSQQDIRKIAPKVLELLNQWSKIENQFIHTTGQVEGNLEGTSIKVNQVWKEILVAFQNRSKLTTRQHYQSDSQVTTKDVVKWIENALQNQQVMDKAVPVQSMNLHSSMPLSKVEQYVIFVNQTQSRQAVESQLMDQFQQVMKTSKFLSMPNGINQLSIAFRPENLGEMIVRLTEINGEMTVKIVVTTQAAKEMLESNINQLRHMFSPQQVVIERQDLGAGQGQNQTKESDEQTLDNQNQNQGQSDESSHQENKHNEKDFEAHLDELIQNVKV